MAVLNVRDVNAENFAVPPASITTLGRTVIVLSPRGSAVGTDFATYAAAIDLLRALHSVKVQHLPEVLANPLLKSGNYDPDLSWQSLFTKRIETLRPNLRDEILIMYDTLRQEFAQGAYASCAPTLVHGDVQLRNMVYLRGAIRLIDWADARIDHPLIDLAQFFFVNAIPNEQAELLVRRYDSNLTILDLRFFGYLNYLWTSLFMSDHPELMQSARLWAEEQGLPHTLSILSNAPVQHRRLTP